MNELKLQEVLSARNEQIDPSVQVRFTETALKALDPQCLHLAFYVGDDTGEQYNKEKLADGSDNPLWPGEPPRDPIERKAFFASIKSKQYASWIERIEAGEFDSEEPKDATPSRIEEPSEPVEVVNEGKEDDECLETCNGEPCPNDKECDIDGVAETKSALDKVDELVEDNATKGTPPPPKMAKVLKDVASSPGTSLLRALDDYIASTDSPQDDEVSNRDAITKLGKIVAEQKEQIDKQTVVIKKLHGALQNISAQVVKTIDEKIAEKLK